MIKIINEKPLVVYSEIRKMKYGLYKAVVMLRGGKKQTIYYFSNPETHIARNYKHEAVALPEGYKIVENPRNGFLTVRK